MPSIIDIFGFKFWFYSNEHLPIHVHVTKGDAEAKIIMEPEIQLEWNRGFKPNEVKKILSIAQNFADDIVAAWHEYFDR